MQYIAVEGVIGVGKTTLTKRLADFVGGYRVLEIVEENPFLSDFYRDRRAYAFQTQVFFLLSRYRQQKRMLQRDLFHGPVISDYMFEKDRIFANINLDDAELDMYNQVFSLMERDLPKPDRIIYLMASVDQLLERIAKRGREFERNMDPAYLEMLADAYNYFFGHYSGAPVMVVNTGEVDFSRDLSLVSDLWRALADQRGGRAMFVPGEAQS